MEDLAGPVFLVQGFGSSVAVLRPLERRVRRIGRAAFCPCPPLGLADIRDAAEVLYEAIERTAAASPFGRADVVGHSMGGLVAAYLLKQLDRGRRISRVVALGTPFRGSRSARLGALLLGPFGRSLHQMTPGSSLLRRLERLPVPSGCALVSIAGPRDWLVPREATRLPPTPGHVDLDAGPFDHWDLLLRGDCFVHVERALRRPDPRAAGWASRPGLAA